jgi:ribonuclease P protein component
VAATNLRSAPKGKPIGGFPKGVRLLRSRDFRTVYDGGFRHAGPFFAAFCLRTELAGPRIGFTTPRALGCAVVRNRLKRRLREAVRARLHQLSPEWSIVINPRKAALQCAFPELEREIVRLFERCASA